VHVHGEVDFNNAVSERKIKSMFPGAHVLACKGTRAQVKDYCLKGGFGFTINEEAAPVGQGHRTDLITFAELIRDGGPDAVRLGLEQYPAYCLRYHGGIDWVRRHADTEVREGPADVWWLYGKPGEGKTQLARKMINEMASGAPIYEFSWDNAPWIGGDYNKQKHVLMDEWRDENSQGRKIPQAFFLKLFGGGPCQLQIKGGDVQFMGNVIFVTSTLHPAQCYEETGGINNPLQFLRRIDHVLHCERDTNDAATAVYSVKEIQRGNLTHPWPLHGFEYL
jgi:RNA helicase